MHRIPVIPFGRDQWDRVVGWEALVEEGVTSASDLHQFHWVETAEEAWKIAFKRFPDAARCV